MPRKKTKKKDRARRGKKPPSSRRALPVQAPSLSTFFKIVVGKIATPAQMIAAGKFLTKHLGPEIHNDSISLERRAALWDSAVKMITRTFNPALRQQDLNILRQHGNFAPTDRVASFGSGNGIMDAFIARYVVPQGRVTCFDISPGMNAFAEKVRAKAQAGNMSIVTASETNTGLPAKSQDKVIMLHSNLIATAHWQEAINEVKRVLKDGPNSRFIFSFIRTSGEAPEEVGKILKRNNFDFKIFRLTRARSLKLVYIAKPKPN